MIERRDFGVMNGKNVELFTLFNEHGLAVKITNYGGAIVSLTVPIRMGIWPISSLVRDCLNDYIKGDASMGALIGRHANR